MKRTQVIKIVRRPINGEGYIGVCTSTAKVFGPYDTYEALAYTEEMNDRNTRFYYEALYITKGGEELPLHYF